MDDDMLACDHERPYSLLQNGIPPRPFWQPKWRTGLNRFSFTSVKLGYDLEVINEHEFHHCMVLECDPFVLFYCVYPIELDGRDNDGKKGRSKPDCWVYFINGIEQLREVKKKKHLKRSRRQIEIQEFWSLKAQMDLRLVIPEDDLPEPLWRNCVEMFPFLSKASNQNIKNEILTIVDKLGGCLLGDLRTEDQLETDRYYTAAFQMLADGILTAPLSKDFIPNIMLRRQSDAGPQEPLCRGTEPRLVAFS